MSTSNSNIYLYLDSFVLLTQGLDFSMGQAGTVSHGEFPNQKVGSGRAIKVAFHSRRDSQWQG